MGATGQGLFGPQRTRTELHLRMQSLAPMGEAGQGFFGPVDGPRATRQWHDQDKVYFYQHLDFNQFLPSAQASKGPTTKPPRASANSW